MSISPVNFNETFISCVPEFIFLSQKLITPTPHPNFFVLGYLYAVKSPPPPTRKHHGYRSPNTTPKIHLSHPFYVPKMQMKSGKASHHNNKIWNLFISYKSARFFFQKEVRHLKNSESISNTGNLAIQPLSRVSLMIPGPRCILLHKYHCVYK